MLLDIFLNKFEVEYKLKNLLRALSFFDCLHSQLLSFFKGLLESTLHVEGSFGIVVSLTFQKSGKGFDSIFKFNELSFAACEDLTHEEWL